MHIVVLDGHTLNPGDISWEPIYKLGKLEVHDRTSQDPKKVLKRIGNAEVVLTNKTLLPASVLQAAPNLKYVGVLATGYNVVDVIEAKRLGITVSNIPAYSTVSVTQFTFALLLELCHRIGDHSQHVHADGWVNSNDFAYWNSPQVELFGLTFGIIGFGAIGKSVAKLAEAFGMKVLVYNRTVYPEFETDNLKFVDKTTLLQESDVVSLHCPLNEDTQHLINAETLKQMKKSAFLINTSRGPVIHDTDLSIALKNKTIAGVAIDVATVEPMSVNNPLKGLDNCIITPHIAWAPKAARLRLMQIAADNIEAYQKKNPINVVS